MSRELRTTLVIMIVALVVFSPAIFAAPSAANTNYLALVMHIIAPTAANTPVPSAPPTRTPRSPVATNTPLPPTPTITPLPVLPLINGGFEEGEGVGWNIVAKAYIQHIPAQAHSGEWSALMGGDSDDDGSLTQYVTVTAANPYLVYWVVAESAELQCTDDYGYVWIGADIVDTVSDFCQARQYHDYRRRVVDLRRYSGQTVLLRLNLDIDIGFSSYWSLDDISFVAKP